MLRLAGPRTLPVLATTLRLATPSETTDAQGWQIHQTLSSTPLARPARMVRRRGLRELLALEGRATCLSSDIEPGRVLRGPAQSPLFTSQSLLLSITHLNLASALRRSYTSPILS